VGGTHKARPGEEELGIGIAFRKKALESTGGFNPQLQVFEYLELGLRSKGFKGIKTQEFTVLHLEPEERFSLTGFLKRRVEYGFWYNSLYYLHPSRLSIYAFPVKLLGFVILLSLSLLTWSFWPLLLLVTVWFAWMIVHFQLLHPENPVAFAAGKFRPSYKWASAYILAVSILSLGELAGDIGKLQGMFGSPTKKRPRA
jgi:hypothetical protein